MEYEEEMKAELGDAADTDHAGSVLPTDDAPPTQDDVEFGDATIDMDMAAAPAIDLAETSDSEELREAPSLRNAWPPYRSRAHGRCTMCGLRRTAGGRRSMQSLLNFDDDEAHHKQVADDNEDDDEPNSDDNAFINDELSESDYDSSDAGREIDNQEADDDVQAEDAAASSASARSCRAARRNRD